MSYPYIPRQPWPGKGINGNKVSEKEWNKGEDERMAALEAAANRSNPSGFEGISARMRGPTALKPSVKGRNSREDREYAEKVARLATAERRAAEKADKNLYAEIQYPGNYKRGGRRSKKHRKTKKGKSKRSSKSKTKRSTKSKTKRSRK